MMTWPGDVAYNVVDLAQVSFQWKNPDFLFRNPDLLIRNLDFLLKNVEFITKFTQKPEDISALQESLLNIEGVISSRFLTATNSVKYVLILNNDSLYLP